MRESFLGVLGALLLAAAPHAGQAQLYTFITWAGSGDPGSADGTNGQAQFYEPYGVAVDHVGNLYVADTFNNTIRKITPAGVVSTLAGSPGLSGSADGTNSQARFNFPWGLAVDGRTNVYVADYFNNTIRKLSPVGADWVVTTLAGTPGVSGSTDGSASEALFFWPAGVAADGGGTVYVTDSRNHTIRRITSAGEVSTLTGVAGSFGAADGTNSDARFYTPAGIALDQAGRLFVTDFDNHTIRKVTPLGTNWVVTTVAGAAGEYGGTDGTNGTARFKHPEGIAVDRAGSLYIAEGVNNTIRGITPVGTNWVVGTLGPPAGSLPGNADGTGSTASFAYPRGVAVAASGNLFVADTANNTIRKGIPASTAAPRLSVAVVGNDVALSWPLSAAGFVVETAGNLAPGVVWVARTNGAGISGEAFFLTEPRGVQPAFYRLRK